MIVKVFRDKKILIVSFLIALITVLVYIPAIQNGFVNWDDNDYIYENPDIRHIGFKSLVWMTTSFHASNWHPLTWLSHAVDYSIWGLNPAGHHVSSVIFHGLNTFLVIVLTVILLSHAMHGKQALNTDKDRQYTYTPLIAGAVTGLLFGLHPLHVESVAWVSERKDVLYAFFFLLSILTYLKYVTFLRKEKVTGCGLRVAGWWYILCLLFFIMALMSKPMAVTLPVVLIILDVYPFKRTDYKRLFIEKLPFLGLSIASSVITLTAQRAGGAVISLEYIPFWDRILVAFRALFFYLYKMVWPTDLAPLYPYPSKVSVFMTEYIASIILVLLVTAITVYLWKRQKVWLAIWAYYVITLLPVLGIITVGTQAAADRYTYLPSIGPFLLFGLAAAKLTCKKEEKDITDLKRFFGIVTVTAVISVLLVSLTLKQEKIWKDSVALWEHALKVYPKDLHGTPKVHNNLGEAYFSQGFADRAKEQFETVLKLRPDYVRAHYNLGNVYAFNGLLDRAKEHYQTAIRLRPEHADSHYNLGNVYISQRMYSKAIEHYQTTIRLKPGYINAYNNLGNVYKNLGMYGRAIGQYKAALRLKPDFTEAHYNLAIAYSYKGLTDKANEHFGIAKRLNPDLLK